MPIQYEILRKEDFYSTHEVVYIPSIPSKREQIFYVSATKQSHQTKCTLWFFYEQQHLHSRMYTMGSLKS
jgi:hypothetical protein